MENIKEILDILAYIIAISSGFAAITPTPKKKGVLGVAYKVIEIAGLVILKAKQK